MRVVTYCTRPRMVYGVRSWTSQYTTTEFVPGGSSTDMSELVHVTVTMLPEVTGSSSVPLLMLPIASTGSATSVVAVETCLGLVLVPLETSSTFARHRIISLMRSMRTSFFRCYRKQKRFRQTDYLTLHMSDTHFCRANHCLFRFPSWLKYCSYRVVFERICSRILPKRFMK